MTPGRNSLNSPVSSIAFDDFSGQFSNSIENPIQKIKARKYGISRSHRTTSTSSGAAHGWFRAWGPEILASILSICALMSIVGVLRAYEGHPLESINLSSALTLNGLLALLGTLLRVLLMVPLGSALSQEAWLWLATNGHRQNPRSQLRDLSLSDAASRGAWGSMILLFFSWRRLLALTGALVMISCLAIDTFTQQMITSANTPVTDAGRYSPGNIPWTQRYHDFQGNPAEAAFGPSLTIKAAAYNGFLANNVTDIQTTCSTGNCTFPFTPSIAVCGSCQDTTNVLTACNSTACNYTTSTGTIFTLASWNNVSVGHGFVSKSVQTKLDNLTAENALKVADFEMLGAPFGSLGSELYGRTHEWKSHRCQLSMCVNVYATTISNGQQSSKVVNSYTTIPNDSGLGFSGGANWTFALPKQWKEDYNVSALAWVALGQQLSNMVGGTALLNLEGYSTTSDAVEAIWSGTQDLQAWISKVSLSLTNAIRESSPAQSTTFNGTAYKLSIIVRWGWIALPLALTVITIVLLVSVMVQTGRSEIGPWKGSPLTMLLFEVDHDLRQQPNDVDWNGFSSGTDGHLANQKVALRRLQNGRFRLKNYHGGSEELPPIS